MDLRLLAALVAPSALVAWGLLGLADLRWTFLLYVFGACALVPALLVGAVPLGRGRGLPFLGGRASRSRAAIAFVLFGPVFLALYAGLRTRLTAPEPYLEALEHLGWDRAHQNLYLLAFVTLVPLFEEWWWRGQALPRCLARYGRTRGILLTAVAFTAYHAFVLAELYSPALALLRLAGIGVAAGIWTIWAARTGNWGETYAAHLGADAALVAAFLWWVVPRAGG